LASVEPIGGRAGDVSMDARYFRGRALIERMALQARGIDYPTLRLSLGDCADVTYFVGHSVPLEPSSWWHDPKDAPSHLVGFMIVLTTVEKSLRAASARP
jgi:hypothetical protein